MSDIEAKQGDVYGSEADNIPASVLDVMKNSGIGNTQTGSDVGDTEAVDTETAGTETTSETTETETEEVETEVKEETEITETAETETTETKSEDTGTEPVPQEHITIGRRYSWPDEKIIKMSEEHPDILEEMGRLIGRQTQPTAEQKVVPAATQKQEVQELKPIDLSEEVVAKMKESYGDAAVTEAILPLAKGLNETRDALNVLRGSVSGVQEANQVNQARREHQEANALFDELTETFEVFGKTEELPRTSDGRYDVNSPAVKARSEVYDVALGFKNAGMSWTESLKQATRWYKGGHVEKSLQRKIVRDINARRKKFSPRPTGKKTVRAFKSREDEGETLVRKAYK